ncbi:uncharacterized protein ALTATR162_LOCUS10754 [Alternaria atra]|uniref:Uncharacterized protein n=1 Tax=Alternaria atra TaxID=119953 RepID=A0A8J2IFK4_9PLEO|nr:uncharacterized protein ALTATR162_LOCUS7992 [Alternaria atra]XP_043174327.1 uncharacterized protein ALTATR162_LOCUS10754 [Alternaria atra]CAG5175171.1 unnamed protein product [Alternaria atra]CAG5183787.1 unnamed protein product [Alternaria atra]
MMGISRILDMPIFSSRFKFHIHIAQVVLVVAALGLTVPRLFMNNVPRSRSSTIALGMGAKSLILLAYLIFSERVSRFQRWHSYKAHAIISCLEVVFWSAVAGLMFQANMDYCKGITCGLSWVVIVIAVIIINSEIICSGISIREFREWKQAGKPKSTKPQHARRSPFDDEEAMQTQTHQLKDAPVQAAERAYIQSEQRNAQPSQSRPHGESLRETQNAPRSHRQERQHRSRSSEHRTRGREEFHMHEMEQPPRYPGQQQYTPRGSR